MCSPLWNAILTFGGFLSCNYLYLTLYYFIVLHLYLSHDKLPQTQWLKASEIYRLTVSVSPKSSRVWLDSLLRVFQLKSRHQPSQRQSSLFQPHLLAEFTSFCLCDGYSHYRVSCWPGNTQPEAAHGSFLLHSWTAHSVGVHFCPGQLVCMPISLYSTTSWKLNELTRSGEVHLDNLLNIREIRDFSHIITIPS